MSAGWDIQLGGPGRTRGTRRTVRARHEVAAARARANTAKIIQENPNIQRMQELGALVKIAGRNGSLVLLPAFGDLLA
jgi:hypothetical protein